jgi:hypothetical protein
MRRRRLSSHLGSSSHLGRMPRELEEALRAVPGASDAWDWTPIDVRRRYARYVAEAWFAPSRLYRASCTAMWAATGQLATRTRRIDWRESVA